MTGAVITSAGIVLAGTFSALGVLPLVPLTEIGFTIAVGVLIDTFLSDRSSCRRWCSRSATGSGGPRRWPAAPAAGRASATPRSTTARVAAETE